MIRRVGSIVAGLMIFGVLISLASFAAKSLWPEYAAAVPDRAYTLPMLLARLATGAVATVIAAWGASKIAQGDKRPALWVGLVLLAISVPWHIHIWNEYPAWYHLVWLGCLIPCAFLGGIAAALRV